MGQVEVYKPHKMVTKERQYLKIDNLKVGNETHLVYRECWN